MRPWKITGLMATLLIILSIPAYLLKERHRPPPGAGLETSAYVGSRKCMDCHKAEYDKWKGSHHDLAMDVASPSTVLGDFNATRVEFHGVVSRFFRKDGRFFVHTQGPDGRPGEFEVTHTFGCYPLQQYLVPFDGGRLQCLPLAWDALKRQWYHLSPDEPVDPADWLYWTNGGQNWNGMCAECHSTNLKKGYDLQKDMYTTTWSEIDVSCEACHGPGSRHVAWAEMPDMARPRTDNFELEVRTRDLDSRGQVELCAPCHSRRSVLGDYSHAATDLLDSLLPSLLTPELYYADGQILEEVYVYGSFTQSKMYRREVRCSDCHDVHSLKLIAQGNDLCLQCHRAAVYDSKDHHFHKQRGEPGEPILSADGQTLFEVGSGAECRACHMPERPYMVIDQRADHSLRVPRPDLSLQLGTPNACRSCHIQETDQWADEWITEWYGPGRRAHYGTILAGGRQGAPEAQQALVELASDQLYPVIVRATALSLLAGSYPAGKAVDQAFQLALMDDEALIRRTAVSSLRLVDPGRQTELLAGMLYDPVLAVRIEAVRRLTEMDAPALTAAQRGTYRQCLAEYRRSMEHSADFAFGRHNLANLFLALGQPDRAEDNYRAALSIDDQFYPATVNLAMLSYQRGKTKRAEALLRDVITAQPELYEVHYSLGLLLAETGRFAEAAGHLQQAADGLPERARIHYNLGLLLQRLNQDSPAEAALLRAQTLEPNNVEFLYALADFYLKRQDLLKAKRMAEAMLAVQPEHRTARKILQRIERF